jgi:pyruvate dehydrogenase E1 component alpha subunit
MSKDQCLKAYKDMLLIRRFEEKAGQLYGMGLIGGFCHLYIGQEAVVVGLQLCLEEKDSVITSYRDHGQMIACGMDPKGVMAELTGREGGYSKGKGGSMHMFSKEKNFYGGHGIVGAQVPIGTGLAFGHKYKEDGGICLAYMGDGGANQGQVYEAYNMATLWNLPVVYVIEDNKYSMGTSTKRHTANDDYANRGEPFNIPGRRVDGMNVFDVYKAGQWAVEEARKGNPTLLHIETYRYRGHSMSDPAKYRSKEEVEEYKKNKDCIETMKQHILSQNYLDEEGFKEINKDIKDIVQTSVDFSKSSPEPHPEELYTDVLIEPNA